MILHIITPKTNYKFPPVPHKTIVNICTSLRQARIKKERLRIYHSAQNAQMVHSRCCLYKQGLLKSPVWFQ